MKTHENMFPLSLLIYPDLSMVFNKKVLYRIYAKNLRMFHRKIGSFLSGERERKCHLLTGLYENGAFMRITDDLSFKDDIG